jgi:hypothetical protein
MEDKDLLIKLLCQQMIGVFELTQISRNKLKAAQEGRYEQASKYQAEEKALQEKLPTIKEVKELYTKIYG